VKRAMIRVLVGNTYTTEEQPVSRVPKTSEVRLELFLAPKMGREKTVRLEFSRHKDRLFWILQLHDTFFFFITIVHLTSFLFPKSSAKEDVLAS